MTSPPSDTLSAPAAVATSEHHEALQQFVARINALHAEGDFDQEIVVLGEAGAACVDLEHDQEYRAFFAQRTVDLVVAWGRLDLAEQLLLSELQKCESTKYGRGLAAAEAALGRVLLERGRPLEAEPLLRDALDFLQTGGDAKEVAVTSMQLSQVLVQLGQLDEAEELLDQAAQGMEQLGLNIGLTQTLSVRGQLTAKRGARDVAIGHLYEAAAQFEEFKQWHMLARNLVALGDVQVQAKYYEDAVSSYNDAQDYFVRGEDHDGRARCHQKCGDLLLEINADLGLAETQFTWARDIYIDLEDTDGQAKAETGLSEIARRRGVRNV